jgi:lysophospholipase L1-like esterase
MKKKIFLFFVTFLSVFTLYAANKVIKIVVLGSSTAAGSGPTNSANAWVNQYRQYIQSINASSEVINLAVGGYSTYQVMPSDYTAPSDRPSPNTEHNITKALSYNPDVIIVNLPTNDAASSYTTAEQITNYLAIKAKADAMNIPMYVATTQPRNLTSDQRTNLIIVRDYINTAFGTKAIDFWTTLANADGTINSTYDSGDGVHLNDAAHTILKDRVVATDILNYSRTETTCDTINIDFGTTLSSGTWNNLNTAIQDTILNLITTQNANSGVSIWIHDPFTGVNTSGTTAPTTTLNFPSSATSDSFFGSVGAHNGIMEPTGGFTLSGLSRNSVYSFSFFASRTGVTDNRETKYVVAGATKDSVSLDAGNNTANIVTVSNIRPTLNGTVVITVSPGSNNTNASKYYFIGAMRITSEKQAVVYDTDGVVNIDFGSTASSGTWNNLTDASGAQSISDLVNTEGNSTGISLTIHDAFTGVNEVGTTTPNASLGIVSTASSDSFFGSVGAHSGVVNLTGGVTLGGLSAGSSYTLSFFASRDGVTDNREATYTVTGNTTASVSLDAANNTANMVTVSKMIPAADGTIKVDVAPGTNNNNSLQYYYLGVMRIEYAPDSSTGIEETACSQDNLSVSLFPNPLREQGTFDCLLPVNGDIQIYIYDLGGKLIHVISNDNLSEGKNQIIWNGTTEKGARFVPGMYICRVTLLANSKLYSYTLKLQIANS